MNKSTNIINSFWDNVDWTITDWLKNNNINDIWGSNYSTAKFKNGRIQFFLRNHDIRAYNCIRCNESVLGDPKYHEMYEEGLLVGYRHRRC